MDLIDIAKAEDRSKRRTAALSGLVLAGGAGAGAAAGAGMVHHQRGKTLALFEQSVKQSRRQALRHAAGKAVLGAVVGAGAKQALKAAKIGVS